MDFQLSQEEINSLITAYTSSDQAFANGFSIAGEKFVTIKADERSVYGKKVSTAPPGYPEMISSVRSVRYMLISICAEG